MLLYACHLFKSLIFLLDCQFKLDEIPLLSSHLLNVSLPWQDFNGCLVLFKLESLKLSIQFLDFSSVKCTIKDTPIIVIQSIRNIRTPCQALIKQPFLGLSSTM